MGNQAPLCLSMIVCDNVSVDHGSNKVTILGAFSNVGASAFPATQPSLVVFAELTDGRGDTEIVLKFCRVTADSIDGDELFRVVMTASFSDPRAVVRGIFGVSPVPFPQAGEYRFILETSSGAFIAERRIVAVQTS